MSGNNCHPCRRQLAFAALSVLLLMAGTTVGQRVDTTYNYQVVDAEKQKFIRAREHLTIVTGKPQFSAIENHIIALEYAECNALLKRDTIVLRRIWPRDYSLDERGIGLANGRNPLPYYTVLNRIIEKLNSTDTVVFTSGIEYVQMLNTDGKVNDVTTRRFFHAWRGRYGIWKLTTRLHESN